MIMIVDAAFCVVMTLALVSRWSRASEGAATFGLSSAIFDLGCRRKRLGPA